MRVVGYGVNTGEKINPYSVLVEIHDENVEGSGMKDTGLVSLYLVDRASFSNSFYFFTNLIHHLILESNTNGHP